MVLGSFLEEGYHMFTRLKEVYELLFTSDELLRSRVEIEHLNIQLSESDGKLKVMHEWLNDVMLEREQLRQTLFRHMGVMPAPINMATREKKDLQPVRGMTSWPKMRDSLERKAAQRVTLAPELNVSTDVLDEIAKIESEVNLNVNN